MGKGIEDSHRGISRTSDIPHTFSINAGAYREDDEHMQGMKALVYTVVFGTLLIAVYELVIRAFHIFTMLNQAIPDRFTLGEIGACGAFIAGVGLFFLRDRQRLLYAMIEIAFALVTAGIAIGRVRTQGNLSVWIAVAASAYLVVRGMENLQKSNVSFSNSWNRFLNSRLFSGRPKEEKRSSDSDLIENNER